MTPDFSISRLLKMAVPFCVLDSTTIAAVANRCRMKSLPAGQLLFVEGDACRDVHVLVDGRVKCYRASSEGREQTLRLIDRPGDTFCLTSAFTTGGNIVSAQTQTYTRLCSIDVETFIDTARRNQAMSLTLVAMVSEEAKRVIELAGSLSLKTATVRLAEVLYKEATAQATENQERIRLPRDRLREEDVAAIVGTVRVHVSRGLKNLARAGAIRVERGTILVCDLRLLKRISEGEADPAIPKAIEVRSAAMRSAG